MGHAVCRAVVCVGILSVLRGDTQTSLGREKEIKSRGGTLEWLVMGMVVHDFGTSIPVAMDGS